MCLIIYCNISTALQLVVKLVEKTKTMKNINARFANVPLPPCKNLKFNSDKYFECYVRNMGMTLYHPTGTCRMGKLNDPRTVVDSKLRLVFYRRIWLLPTIAQLTHLFLNIGSKVSKDSV